MVKHNRKTFIKELLRQRSRRSKFNSIIGDFFKIKNVIFFFFKISYFTEVFRVLLFCLSVCFFPEQQQDFGDCRVKAGLGGGRGVFSPQLSQLLTERRTNAEPAQTNCRAAPSSSVVVVLKFTFPHRDRVSVREQKLSEQV